MDREFVLRGFRRWLEKCGYIIGTPPRKEDMEESKLLIASLKTLVRAWAGPMGALAVQAPKAPAVEHIADELAQLAAYGDMVAFYFATATKYLHKMTAGLTGHKEHCPRTSTVFIVLIADNLELSTIANRIEELQARTKRIQDLGGKTYGMNNGINLVLLITFINRKLDARSTAGMRSLIDNVPFLDMEFQPYLIEVSTPSVYGRKRGNFALWLASNETAFTISDLMEVQKLAAAP